jgi:2-octaprenylphenol hydroxylase
MQQADEAVFNQALNIAFDNRLGLCQLASERQTFPLTGRYARSLPPIVWRWLAMPRTPSIRWPGRANLGFMDAAELIDELRACMRRAKILVSTCICAAMNAAASTAPR